MNLVGQIKEKLKKTIMISANADEETIKNAVHNEASSLIEGKTIVKEIYVKNKIYNIVVK